MGGDETSLRRTPADPQASEEVVDQVTDMSRVPSPIELARAVCDDARQRLGREMFELQRRGEVGKGELVREARTARTAGYVCFQVLGRKAGRRSLANRNGEFEAARLVDLLEAEGWRLENVADATEHVNDGAYRARTPTTIVGTIYTFRVTGAP